MIDHMEKNIFKREPSDSNQPKPASFQAYVMLVYRKAVHPEFFGIEGRRRITHPDYEFEGWIFKGGHSGRFQFANMCVCEVVVEGGTNLPDRGLLANLPCGGERDHTEVMSENLTYMTTIQTENLSEHLYSGTYREMMAHIRDSNSLHSIWNDAKGRPNLSLIDMQRYRNEVHIQGFHLRGDSGMVLRTQSMFKMGGDKAPVANSSKTSKPTDNETKR